MLTAPLLGAGYVLALAALAGARAQTDDADLGDVRRAEAVATFVERRFGGEITRMKIGIAATAIAVGLALGLAADVLMRLRHARRPRGGRGSSARVVLEALALVASLHALVVLWSMADSPQLYAARWYARGGGRRTVQVLATDVLGPAGVVTLGVALAVLYVRPARLVALARRVRSTLARPVARWLRSATGVASAIGALALGGVAAFRVPRAGAADAGPGIRPQGGPESVDPEAARPATNAARGEASAALPAAVAAGARPNVLLLAADSLREDRLDPRVAPNLARLAARGTRFDRAYVSLPRTFPSWVTILTGRHAHHHGVRSMFPTWEDRARDFDALPERLARAGYATGVVSDYAGDIFGRVDLGFAEVDTPSFDFRQLVRQRALEREAPLLPVLHSRFGRRLFPVMRELNDAADPMLLAGDVEVALERMARGPFFLTVFFSTAHFPYAAPAPYYAKYTDPSYRGRFKYHKPVGLADEAAPDADDARQIRALYDGSVRAIDDAVSRVLAQLERLGIADRTIVVVTADHGETLFENGHGHGHGDHLFGDEGTHVPLVIVDPRATSGRGRREGRIVRDVDLAPTLYELTGVAKPADLDGRSLAGAVRGGPLEPRFAYAESELWFTEDIPALPPELRLPYPGIMALTELDARHNAEIVLRREMTAVTLVARHRMVRDERYKLVYVPTRTGVKYMLFDTEADPGETRDVARELPAEVARLRAELWAWMLADPKMEAQSGFLVPQGGAFRAPGAAAQAGAR